MNQTTQMRFELVLFRWQLRQSFNIILINTQPHTQPPSHHTHSADRPVSVRSGHPPQTQQKQNHRSFIHTLLSAIPSITPPITTKFGFAFCHSITVCAPPTGSGDIAIPTTQHTVRRRIITACITASQHEVSQSFV